MKKFIYPIIIISFLLTSCSEKENNVDNWERLANLDFPEAYPTKEATNELYNEMLFQRASQSVLWSMPAMTLWYMKKGSESQFSEGSNVFPIWKDTLNAKTLVSTPNSDVIYGMGTST